MPEPTLADLAGDPARVAEVPEAAVPGYLAALAGLQAALLARLVVAPRGEASAREDRLLTVDEAAGRLGISKDWLYRRANRLPFVRRLDGGTLRVSEAALGRWMASRPKG